MGGDGEKPPLGWVIWEIGPCWEAAVWNAGFVARIKGRSHGCSAQQLVSCARAPEGWGRLGLPGCSARTVPGPQE